MSELIKNEADLDNMYVQPEQYFNLVKQRPRPLKSYNMSKAGPIPPARFSQLGRSPVLNPKKLKKSTTMPKMATREIDTDYVKIK